jgi:putative SOS response-associated peptidase YedK
VDHIAHIHGRMPVILEESAYDAWLSGEAQGDDAKALLLDNHLGSGPIKGVPGVAMI